MDGSIISKRTCGLRVYMKRPWYSSGDGELLGVVLANKPWERIGEAHREYVTQWGQDPIWESGNLNNLPTGEHIKAMFPRIVKSKVGLTIPEVSDLLVNVAGHDVHYDETRQIWYSDIQIASVGNYFPFIRLALARFQPNSVEQAHLSNVYLTDFIQIPPNRSATIAFLESADGVKKVSENSDTSLSAK